MQIGVNRRPDLPVGLVLGAGGMGLSTARRLGQSHRIVVASLSVEQNAACAAALAADGVDARTVECDITDPESVEELSRVIREHGRLRSIAHVAALSPANGDWQSLLTVNLVGAARVERMCRDLAEVGTAAVFVSSMGARWAQPTEEQVLLLDDPLADGFVHAMGDLLTDRAPGAVYGLTKFGINRMCRRRAADWGSRGARIVSVSPGMIATPMGAREFAGESGAVKRKLLAETPIQREGTLVETADAIEFLLSDRASYITGTDLLVDGGATAVAENSSR